MSTSIVASCHSFDFEYMMNLTRDKLELNLITKMTRKSLTLNLFLYKYNNITILKLNINIYYYYYHYLIPHAEKNG